MPILHRDLINYLKKFMPPGLRPYQKKAIDFFSKNNELYLNWDTGCGKTITAIHIANEYIHQNPKKRVIVICPKSILDNFYKEASKYWIKLKKNYQFYTPSKILSMHKRGEPLNCRNTLIIIDEVHNLRTITSATYNAVFECVQQSRKRLLLSATPFVNHYGDLVSQINLLYGREVILPTGNNGGIDAPIGCRRISVSTNNPRKRKMAMVCIWELMQGKVSFVSKKNNDEFPSCSIKQEYIEMTQEYYNRYTEEIIDGLGDVFRNPQPFYNGYRRAVNSLGPAYAHIKIQHAISQIESNQTLIFSNWLKFGVKVLEQELRQKSIKYGIICGETPLHTRSELVTKFNNGDISTLIVTRAGNEGLDLKGVKKIIILDPVWNPSKMEQIIGRGVRYRSHHHLPKEERNVDVHQYLLVEPGYEEGQASISGDVIIYGYITQKTHQLRHTTNLFQSMSI